MSFLGEIKNELIEIPIKKKCCKKAFLFGLIINAHKTDDKSFETDYLLEVITDKATEYLKTIFSVVASKQTVSKPGKKYYRLSFSSVSIVNAFALLENDPEATIPDVASFRCPMCEQAFLRGVFVSCAKLNDPQKGYNLEFYLTTENISRTSKLYRFLSTSGFVAKITNRANGTGLYYRNNSTISDLLYYIGAVKSSFEYANAVIEKEIRNNENRATNCVARNIYKSVNAAQKQLNAINKLIEMHRLDALPEELKETARIRIENEEATLSELAALHNPPISKSGLNHRLDKLCKEAEFIEERNQ